VNDTVIVSRDGLGSGCLATTGAAASITIAVATADTPTNTLNAMTASSPIDCLTIRVLFRPLLDAKHHPPLHDEVWQLEGHELGPRRPHGETRVAQLRTNDETCSAFGRW
jgi:hypothetical protein